MVFPASRKVSSQYRNTWYVIELFNAYITSNPPPSQHNDPVIPGLTDSDIVCNFVLEHLDWRSPFRETAPSRSAALQISPSQLRTRSGFFSLAVFRGITYGSPFLLQRRQTFFTSTNAFNASRVGYQDEEVLNKRAYSRNPVSQRSLDHLSTYWEVGKSWEEFTARSTKQPIPFDDAHKELKEIRKAKLLPALGGLTMILTLGEFSTPAIITISLHIF